MSNFKDSPINQSLLNFNSFKVDVNAKFITQIHKTEELNKIRNNKNLCNLRRLIIGEGSNILLTKNYEGLVINMMNQGISRIKGDRGLNLIKVQAGENWHNFVKWSLRNRYPGLENLSLIPGSVGAAPIQNIGAYGIELSKFFYSLNAYDFESGKIFKFSKKECKFSYRDSIFKYSSHENLIIIDVTFNFPSFWKANINYPELTEEIDKMKISNPNYFDISNAVISIRKRKLPDPKKIGNVGSFFKNPIVSKGKTVELLASYPSIAINSLADNTYKISAGWLIEKCGWKGKSIGKVSVHNTHALILKNNGGASGEEILKFAENIKYDVKKMFQIDLEIEPKII